MERRTFLKILSSAGIVSLVSPTFAMEVCKTRCLNLLQLFSNPLFVIRLSLPEFIHGGIG